MNTKTKYLIVVAGPTGVGKTETAIQLAKHFRTEIISADARQLYKELNIGTAKPSASELAEVKHHFINSLSIQESYDVGKYEEDVIKLLEEIYKKHDAVILCGGSGLFIHAVLHGLDELPASDPATRNILEERLKKEGIKALQSLLQEKDPEYFLQVDLQNPHRIIRALEVCLTTGKKYSELRKKNATTRNFTSINLFLNLERETLYDKINKRVDLMMQNGLLKEAEDLYQIKHLKPLNTLGYKELFDYNEGKYDFQTAVEKIKQNSRNYAKRQLTWLKKYFQAEEFKPVDIEAMVIYIQSKML